MNKVELNYEDKSKLAQTTSPKVEMCFLDEEYKGLHVPVFCKDYLNEVVATELDGYSRLVYGFKSKVTGNLLNKDTFKLALIHTSEVFPDTYIESLEKLIPQLDINRGFIPTSIERTQDSNIIVVEGDIRWLSKPAYLSYYTLMLRVAMGYDNDTPLNEYIESYPNRDSSTMCNRDDKYILNKGLVPFIIYLSNGGEIDQTFEDYGVGLDPTEEDEEEEGDPMRNPYNLHNNSGVKTYFYNILKSKIPDVIKEEEKVH